MKAIFLFAVSLTLSVTAVSCKSPTAPIDNTPPGKSNYVWSMDSVNYGSKPGTIQLESIWGSSDTSVWGAGNTSDVRDCLWHYNGSYWSRATAGTPITEAGSTSKIVGIVWGTSPTDVWAFGDQLSNQLASHGEAFVMHYDGSQWTDATGTLTSLASGFFDVSGENANDFWLAAYQTIVHYNNGVWTQYAIGDSMLVWGITATSGRVYAIAYDIGAGGNYVGLYSFINGKFQVVDHTARYNGKFEVGIPWISGGRIYTAWHDIWSAAISSNGGVDGSSWREDLAIPAGYVDRAFYHDSKDVWLVGYPNLLYHYDGTSWEEITITVNGNPAPLGEYSAAWTDGNQIFVCDKDNGIIYHGR